MRHCLAETTLVLASIFLMGKKITFKYYKDTDEGGGQGVTSAALENTRLRN